MASIGTQRSAEADPSTRTTQSFGPAIARRQSLRIAGPRRALPSRRAALGALLVSLAALLAFVAARPGEGTPRDRYLVATRDLAPGTVLTDQDVTAVAVELPASLAADAIREGAELGAAVLRGPVAAGSLLTNALVAAGGRVGSVPADADATGTAADRADGARFRELSFAVPRARALLGDLAPGDRIDVLASVDNRTEVLVQQALVLATSNGADRTLVVSDDVVITVALPDGGAALALAHGATTGELTVIRSTRATDRLAAGYPATSTTAAPGTTRPVPPSTTTTRPAAPTTTGRGAS